MFRSVPTRSGWDLSEEDVQPDISPGQLEAIEEEVCRFVDGKGKKQFCHFHFPNALVLQLATVRFSGRRFCLNLSYSRLSLLHLQKIIGLLEKYDKLDVNLGFCGQSVDDVQSALTAAKHPE